MELIIVKLSANAFTPTPLAWLYDALLFLKIQLDINPLIEFHSTHESLFLVNVELYNLNDLERESITKRIPSKVVLLPIKLISDLTKLTIFLVRLQLVEL